MSYYLINNTQYQYNDDFTVTIENWDQSEVSVIAVDSRGISTTVTKTLTLATYTPLEKGTSSVTRDGNVSEETKLIYNGVLQKTLPNGSNNTLTISYQYKKTNAESYTTGSTNIVPTIDSNGNFNLEKYISGDTVTGFSINDSFNVRVNVADVLSSIQYDMTLNSGIPAIAVKGNNVAIHGPYDENLGGTQLNGNVYLNGSLLNFADTVIEAGTQTVSSITWEYINETLVNENGNVVVFCPSVPLP